MCWLFLLKIAPAAFTCTSLTNLKKQNYRLKLKVKVSLEGHIPMHQTGFFSYFKRLVG